MVTPALRALAKAHAGVRIDAVTVAPYMQLLEGLPYVDRVWTMKRTNIGSLELLHALRGERYDAVVDFFCNSRTALIARAVRADVRVGYETRGRDWAYGRTVPRQVSIEQRGEYSASTHIRLAETVGATPDGLRPDVAVPADADVRAERQLGDAALVGRAVGLVPAGTWAAKALPVSHSARLARRLMAEGWPVVAICGPGEERVGETLVKLAPGVRVLPKGSLLDLVSVVRSLAALVGTDSGPRHIATAFDVPTYSWFGPIEPGNWTLPFGPHGYWQTDLPCRACGYTSCAHWSCMASLHPDEAADRVLAHLKSHVAAEAQPN